MSKFETAISSSADCNVTLFHDPDDPSTWIIRRWKRGLLGRRCVLSRWFTTRGQAEAYAEALLEECGGSQVKR